MSVKKEKEDFSYIIDFIQKEMVYGKISVADLPSGVVTELTPLVMLLKCCKIQTLLIEEPEISLHPELQWKMARLIIRLVYHGVPVFVTMHSDLINEGQVKVYQFNTIEDNNTEIENISCSDYGFEMMTFYNTLEQLSSEIDKIEGYMEEE